MKYLSFENALVAIDELGFVIVDAGLLASAIARPQTVLFGTDAYPDLWTKAAALMHSLARNHSLLDGNKRAAFILTSVMLELNGVELEVSADEGEEFVLEVCQGSVALEDIGKWIAVHCEVGYEQTDDDDEVEIARRAAIASIEEEPWE